MEYYGPSIDDIFGKSGLNNTRNESMSASFKAAYGGSLPPGVTVSTELPKVADAKEAIRFDEGKTNWSLMPFEAIEEINKVLEFGAKKYASWNWTKGGGFKYSRVINSLLRHTFAFMRGEDNDPESGLSHLAHMGCNIVFLIYYNKYKDKFNGDDRVISRNE